MSEVLERFLSLVDKVANDGEMGANLKELVVAAACAPAKYYDSAITAVIENLFRGSVNYDPELVMGRDRERREAHKVCTNSINQLNRWAVAYDLDPIFDTQGKVLDCEVKEDRELAAVLGWELSTKLFLKEMYHCNHYFVEKYADLENIFYEMSEKGVYFNKNNERLLSFEEIKTKAEELARKENDGRGDDKAHSVDDIPGR